MIKKYSVNFLKIFLIYILILFSSFAFSQTINNKEKILHLELDITQLILEVPEGKSWELIKVFTSFPATAIKSESNYDYFIVLKSINKTPLTYQVAKEFYCGPILYSSSHLYISSLPIIFKEKTIFELATISGRLITVSPRYSFYNNSNPIFVTIIEREI